MLYPWEMSILDGALAVWLKAKLAVIGNTSITGDLDVSGTITGDAIPIENLSNVDKQSFENLLDNGDFRLWPNGDSNVPAGWTLGGGASVARESTIIKINSNSAKLTRGAATGFLFMSIPNPIRYRGRNITAKVWIYCSDANSAKIRISDDSSAAYSDFHTGGGGWECLKQTFAVDAAATNINAYVGLYGSSGDFAYISGFISVEGDICPAFSSKSLTNPTTYGEMYIHDNSTATVIETADSPIAVRQISEGLTNGLIFHAGSTDNILGFSGTPAASPTTVSSFAHGLSTGDIVTIRGTTNYNGIFEVTYVGVNSFSIDTNFVADDGASDWDQGASLTVQPGAEGIYTSTWQMTAAPAGACRAIFHVNINATPQNKSGAPRELAINDEDNNSSTCLLDVSVGDIIWLSVESDATTDITHTYGNINLERLV